MAFEVIDLKYIVQFSAVSMSPNPAYKGDILTEDQFSGSDIDWLLEKGAIAVYDEPEVQSEAEKPTAQTATVHVEVPLYKRNRADLNAIAADLGIEGAEEMANRNAVIEAIKTAQDESE